MAACQNCGNKGSKHLHRCAQCHIAAIHSYCVDDSLKLEIENNSWMCRDCESKKVKLRRSACIALTIDKEGFRRKTRRRWRNNGFKESEKQKFVEQVMMSIKSTQDFRHKVDMEKSRDYLESSISQGSNDLCMDASTILENNEDCFDQSQLQYKNFQLGKDVQHNEECFEKSKQSTSQSDISSAIEYDDHLDSCNQGDLDQQMVNNYNEGHNTIMKTFYFNKTMPKHVKMKCEFSFDERGYKHYEIKPYIIENLDVSKQQCCSVMSTPYDNKRLKRRRLILETEDSDEEIEKFEDVIEDSEEAAEDTEEEIEIFEEATEDCSKEEIEDCEEEKECVMHVKESYVSEEINDVVSAYNVRLNTCATQPHGLIGKYNEDAGAKPVVDAIWRGRCCLSYEAQKTSFELMAHLSSKASDKAQGAASVLPELLEFKLVPKLKVWPKTFEITPPTSNDIALYFFPTDERDEIQYNVALEEMIDQQLVLKSKINNLDLLLFSSRELPQDQWRIGRKYYMWAVFKPNHNTITHKDEEKMRSAY